MADYTLDELAADLQAAASRAEPDIDKVLKKAANNIKKDWRAAVRGDRRLHLFPNSITYDKKGDGWEIGPDRNLPQGKVGNIIEYGSVYHAPGNEGKTALDAEAPQLEDYIMAAVVKRLKG